MRYRDDMFRRDVWYGTTITIACLIIAVIHHRYIIINRTDGENAVRTAR